MTKQSMILIDEMIIPRSAAHWKATQLDMTTMSCLGGLERTEEQWHTLLGSAGLQITDIYRYTEELQDSIIVAF